MNIKDCDIQIARWRKASHYVKNDNRDPLVELFKEGGGDHYYAKDCTKAQAMIQIKLAIEDLEWEKQVIMEEMEA